MDWIVLLPRERRKCRSFALLIAWVFVYSVRISRGQDFRIDNQLRIQANDCYTRIAIGSRMPDSAVTSTVPVSSLSDCEVACSGNRTICNAFSFGIDARGNGTCRIGRMDLNTRGNDLVMDPEYDVYERRAKMPRGCQHDRLLRIGFGVRMPNTSNPSNANNTALSRQQLDPQGNGQGTMMMMNGQGMMNVAPRRRPQNPFGNPFATGATLGNDSPRDPSFFRGGWYSPIADDSDSRLYDIINNKKNYKSNQRKQTHQHHEKPHEHYPEHHHSELHSDVAIHEDDEHDDYIYRSTPFGDSQIDDKWSSRTPESNSKWNENIPGSNPKWTEDIPGSKSKWTEDISGSNSKWSDGIPGLNSKWTESTLGSHLKWTDGIPGFGDFGSKWNAGFGGIDGIQKGILHSTSTNAPGFGTRGLFGQGDGLGFSAGTTVDPILEKTKSCYRKLLAGKRLADSHVRRNIQCSRIEECHRVCEYESNFVCEGFNYGRMQEASGRGRHGDRSYVCQLTSLSAGRMDPRRDFVQDPRYDYYERDWRCPAEKPGQVGSSDWSSGHQRPHWHPPPPPPPVRRPPNDISRPPQRPNDRYPSPEPPGTSTYYYFPEKPRPSVSRPNDYDYYSGAPNFLPQRPQNDVIHYHRPPQPPHRPPQLPPGPPQQPLEPPRGPSYLPNPNYYYPADIPLRPGHFPNFPDRRLDQNGWHRPQQESRPNEVIPDRDWNKRPKRPPYIPNKDWPDSGVYGPSYGYENNRFDGRFPDREPPRRPSNSYPGDDDTRPSKPQIRPTDQQDYYGYHYGPAYGYDAHAQHPPPMDSYVPNWKPHMQPGSHAWGGSRDCSVRSVTGFKLVRKIVDASFTTANLEECEMLCASRGDCRSFAYRYSLTATAPTDNCLLCGVHFYYLDFYTDLEPDRDYDIYAIISGLENCQGSKKPSTEVQPHHRLPEECFWRVRSGYGIPVSLTRKELRVENGLGECQIACVSSRQFTCRSFVFRYESDRDRGPNCFLSDCPSSEIIPGEGAGLPRVDQAELYERGSYGRGCEPYPFATIYNPANFDKPKPWTGGTNHMGNRGDESCYSGYQGGCKLSPYAVSTMTRVDSETECRRKCSRMRNNPHSPCMSFSFKIGDEKRGDNCYLSDVPRRDLRPGLDYVYDDDYVMYAWKELEPQCSLGPAGYPHTGGFPGFNQNSAGGGQGSWSGGASPDGRPPYLGPGNGFLSYNHLVLGVRPLDPDRPDPVSPPDYLPHPTTPQNDDGYFPGTGSGYPDGFASFNRHYTVNGLPCKRGTKCERNQIVGFWSCEPEGSELGSWDYCCEPNHHCGFSQGYRYPWCYVGPSEDQWRPCSDKYFPYLPSPRPAVRPNNNNNEHGGSRPPYQHPGQAFGGEDSATYNSRHWPIAFLHPQPPPNTTDSVALAADDRRDDPPHRNNASKETSANKTRAPSAELTNSPITRLQLHKSHLKRRGLVSANRTRLLAKNASKKIRRITIVPADKKVDSASLAPPYGAKYTAEKSLDSKQSSYFDNSTNPTKKNDRLEVVHLGATLQSVGLAKKRKGNVGRVERVTKPARTTSDAFETSQSKDETERMNFSGEFDAVSSSTPKRAVFVPVALTLRASNDSGEV